MHRRSEPRGLIKLRNGGRLGGNGVLIILP